MSEERPEFRLPLWKRALFLGFMVPVLAVMAEIGARGIDFFSDISVSQLRDTYAYRRNCRMENYWPAQRGDYPYLPFVPNPQDPRVNELGFRGEEITLEKPADTYRILCLGGSTTWDEYPARLQEQLADDFAAKDLKLEVINGGNVFYTSMESLLNFVTRGLPLEPDAIVVYHAINDSIPAFGDTTSLDYSHWRGRLEKNEPIVWDYLPTWFDHSAAFVGLRAMFERNVPTLGWNQMTMKYSVDFENSPYNGVEPYRQNIFSLITLARARGVEVFLCTPVFNYDYEFKSSLDRWGKAVEEANQITRSFDGRWDDVHIIDVAASLKAGNDWMTDMCHFTTEGKVKLARFIAGGIRPTIDELVSGRGDPYELASLMPQQRETLASTVTEAGE